MRLLSLNRGVIHGYHYDNHNTVEQLGFISTTWFRAVTSLPEQSLQKEDPATSAIRDHRTNARRGRRLDRDGASEVGPVPLSESCVCIAPSIDPTILPDRREPGRVDWARCDGLWHPFPAAHQTDVDLRRTNNLRAVQLLIGHTKLESTVRYLDRGRLALEIAEHTEV